MAIKPETLFRMKVRSDLGKVTGLYFFPVQQKGMRGDSDYCLCVGGRFVSLELKASRRSRVEKLQIHKLHSVERCGGFGIISYPGNWDTVFSFLQDLVVNPNVEKPECLSLPMKHLETQPLDLE